MGSSRLSRSFVEELLSRVDIVDVISHYITLKQVGRNFTALCPFHPEKTPSFVVSPEKQIFKCFGCGVGGNAITFVEKYEGVSFFEAVKRVAEICGVELPEGEFKEEESFTGEFGERAAKLFHSHLDKVLPYLQERGIDRETAQKFLLGYAPRGYLKELKDFPKEVLEALGLINRSGKEFFAERLIIPIFNHSGRVVAFAGRALKEGASPKYINSPESSAFKKGSLLYGFYQSKEEILKRREVIVVEGYFDVISLHKAGVKRAVAPMGTSLTENHGRFIKRYCQKPLLLFDGDSAGRKATVRSAGIFFKLGCEPLVVQLPDGEDPDSMAVKSPELLLKLISSPLPFIEWAVKTAKLLEGAERGEFLKLIAQALSQLEAVNPILFKEYLAPLSAEFGIDEKWIKLHAPRVYVKKEGSVDEVPPPYYEKVFLKALLEGSLKLPVEISPTVFVSNRVAKLYTYISKGDYTPTALQAELPEEADFISELLLMEVTEDDVLSAMCKVLTKELESRLKRAKELNEKMRIKRLIFSLKRGDLGAVSQIQIN